jgi:hypothetical protein
VSAPVERVGGGRGRRESRLASGIVLVLLAIGVSILKPWGASSPGVVVVATPSVAAEIRPSVAPSATPSPTPKDPATAVCLAPSGWRIMSSEWFDGQSIRVWQTIDPVGGTDPADPALPVGLVVSSSVRGVGWCAPTTAGARPVGPVVTRVWSIPASGDPVLLDLRSRFGPSDLGVEFLPPIPADGVEPADWPPGRYVFAIEDHGSGRSYSFALEVRRFEPDRPSPTPTAPVPPSTSPLP